MIEKDGRFFLFEPGLALIGSGANIDEAYAQYVDLRRRYVSDIEMSGLAPVVFARPSKGLLKGVLVELSTFLAKTILVVLVLAGLLVAAVIPVTTLSIADVADKAFDVAVDMQGMKEDQRRKLSQSIGEISRQLRSFAESWQNPPREPLDPAAFPRPRKDQ
ncbi:hypothetical protein [Sphingomonas daechungensis]|uniref:hypothetical protein n=1 Tax=Sphingomonas daechungensis TaxID=1176646 RepID=UPI003782D9F8